MDILEQTNPNKNKWISFLADGILSGLMLGIGGMVSLSSENRFLGAFLFSLGLFCIVQFKYGLFTGKVGYIVNRDLPYVAETAVTLVGNALGTLIAALLLRQVRFFTSTVSTMDVTISDRVQATVSGKIHDNPLSIFILAVFCGILMFTAVEGSRKCKEEKTVRRCHAGYGLYYLRIQPLYCRYVLLFLCWLPRAIQGNCLLHSCHCRKQCWRYDCSAAEKVIESATLKKCHSYKHKKRTRCKNGYAFFHAKYSNSYFC